MSFVSTWSINYTVFLFARALRTFASTIQLTNVYKLDCFVQSLGRQINLEYLIAKPIFFEFLPTDEKAPCRTPLYGRDPCLEIL